MKSKIIVTILVVVLIFTMLPISISANETEENFLIEYSPQYKALGSFNNQFALVQLEDGSIAVIDINNNTLASFDTTSAYCSNGVVSIIKDNSVMLYDMTGQLINVYDGVGAKSVVDGKIAIKDDNLMQDLYDVNGNKLTENKYEDIVYGNGDCVFLNDGNSIVLVNIVTNETVSTGLKRCVAVTENFVVCTKDNRYGVMDYNGNTLIPFDYDNIAVGSSGYFRCETTAALDVFDSKYQKVGTIASGTFYSIGDISDGVMSATNKEKEICYINVKGEIIISELDCEINVVNNGNFSEGYAVVRSDKEATYIDKSGKQATSKTWDYAYNFSYGYALVMNRRYDDNTQQYQNMWYIIDTDFEIVKALDYDVYVDPYYGTGSDFSDGYIRIADKGTGLMGFIKLNSEVVENKPEDSTEPKPDDTTSPDEGETGTEQGESETNPPITNNDNIIDSIADKIGVTSDQLLMIAGGSLAALVLLIIVIAAIKRKRR